MPASNYTVLQQNVLASLQSEESKKAFLWACDRPTADRYQYNAEAYAREVELIAGMVTPIISSAMGHQPVKPHDIEATKGDLLDFMLKRHRHWRFP